MKRSMRSKLYLYTEYFLCTFRRLVFYGDELKREDQRTWFVISWMFNISFQTRNFFSVDMYFSLFSESGFQPNWMSLWLEGKDENRHSYGSKRRTSNFVVDINQYFSLLDGYYFYIARVWFLLGNQNLFMCDKYHILLTTCYKFY